MVPRERQGRTSSVTVGASWTTKALFSRTDEIGDGSYNNGKYDGDLGLSDYVLTDMSSNLSSSIPKPRCRTHGTQRVQFV